MSFSRRSFLGMLVAGLSWVLPSVARPAPPLPTPRVDGAGRVPFEWNDTTAWVGVAEPTTPTVGNLWYCTVNREEGIFRWDGEEWGLIREASSLDLPQDIWEEALRHEVKWRITGAPVKAEGEPRQVPTPDADGYLTVHTPANAQPPCDVLFLEQQAGRIVRLRKLADAADAWRVANRSPGWPPGSGPTPPWLGSLDEMFRWQGEVLNG